MPHRYKRYSKEQLQAEVIILQEKLQEAEKSGQRNHVAVNRRKIEIVRSYMLDQADFKPGDIWELKEEPESRFKIDGVSGVVAWGYRVDSLNHKTTYEEREAVLIALLGEKV